MISKKMYKKSIENVMIQKRSNLVVHGILRDQLT